MSEEAIEVEQPDKADDNTEETSTEPPEDLPHSEPSKSQDVLHTTSTSSAKEKLESYEKSASKLRLTSGHQSDKQILDKDFGVKSAEFKQRTFKVDKYNSRAKLALGSVMDIRKSIMTDTAEKRAARFMNTYKLDSDNPFNAEKVDKILKSVMMEAMENLTYDRDKCLNQVKWASMIIRSKVKDLEFDR